MNAERSAEADQLRARGQRKLPGIRAKADREAVETVAQAQAEREILRGEGEGERNAVFAAAFQKDPEFFAFYRSMQAYAKRSTSRDDAGTFARLRSSSTSSAARPAPLRRRRRPHRRRRPPEASQAIAASATTPLPGEAGAACRSNRSTRQCVRLAQSVMRVAGQAASIRGKRDANELTDGHAGLTRVSMRRRAPQLAALSAFALYGGSRMTGAQAAGATRPGNRSPIIAAKPVAVRRQHLHQRRRWAASRRSCRCRSFREGSPFQDFFDDFFKDQPGGDPAAARKVHSLGSGFVVDAEQGIIVTNNHVIADADEIEVNFNDGAKLKAELVGTRHQDRHRRAQGRSATQPLTAVKFGNSDTMRVGDWVMAIGNPVRPRRHGDASASSRRATATSIPAPMTTSSRPTPPSTAAIRAARCSTWRARSSASTPPSSRRRAARSASASRSPRNSPSGVVDQLANSARRGAAGSACASSRSPTISPKASASSKAKGALVADVITGGPADKAGIQPGDVIIKFDGKDVNEMRDLPRVVAESPVGKAVDVESCVRKGVEQTVKVTLGRLEDGEKLRQCRGHAGSHRAGRGGARHEAVALDRRSQDQVQAAR